MDRPNWSNIRNSLILNKGPGRDRSLFYSRLPTADPSAESSADRFNTWPSQGNRRHSLGGIGTDTANLKSFFEDDPLENVSRAARGSGRHSVQIGALGVSEPQTQSREDSHLDEDEEIGAGPVIEGFFEEQAALQEASEEPVAEDPKHWSSFVEKSWFQGISAVVIISNVITTIVELDKPYLKSWFFYPDQVMLAFYLVELSLRATYFGRQFLCGPPKSVCWNCLDITVVGAGLLDQWIMPVLPATGDKESIGNILQLLRLLRLLRVFKIVRVFLDINLSWTEAPAFQSFIGVVILINSLLMGMEIDVPWIGWFWFEQVLLCIYVFELSVRLKNFGRFFFSCKNGDIVWNILDFFIVGSSVLDSWLTPLANIVAKSLTGTTSQKSHGMSLGKFMMLMRMLRLMRILRLAKLVKSVRPLYILVTGVMAALQGVAWVLVLTIVTLYAMGILATSLIGKKMAFAPDAVVSQDIIKPFSSVPDSMFTLFRVMSGAASDAEQVAIDDLMGQVPSIKLGFVFFMITSSWTLLSILTAVVSENMISTTNQQEEEHKLANAEEDRIEHVHKLKELFDSIDVTGDGEVDFHEIEAFLSNKKNALLTARRCRVPVRDVREVLQFLTEAGDGETVSLERFVEYLADLSHVVTEKSVMKIEAKLTKLSRHTSEHFKKLEEQFAVWQAFVHDKLESSFEESHSKAAEAVGKGPFKDVERLVLGLAQTLKKEVQQVNQHMNENVTKALEHVLPRFGVDEISETLRAEFSRIERELLCSMKSQESGTTVRHGQEAAGIASMSLMPADQELPPTSLTSHSAAAPQQAIMREPEQVPFAVSEKQTASASRAQAQLSSSRIDPLIEASINSLQQQGAAMLRKDKETVSSKGPSEKMSKTADQGMAALAADEFAEKMASEFRMMRQELLSCLGRDSPDISNLRSTAQPPPVVATQTVTDRPSDVQMEVLAAQMEARLNSTEESIHGLQQKTEAMLGKVEGLLGKAVDHGLSGIAVDKFLEILESELCMMRQEWLLNLGGQDPEVSKVRDGLRDGAERAATDATSTEADPESPSTHIFSIVEGTTGSSPHTTTECEE